MGCKMIIFINLKLQCILCPILPILLSCRSLSNILPSNGLCLTREWRFDVCLLLLDCCCCYGCCCCCCYCCCWQSFVVVDEIPIVIVFACCCLHWQQCFWYCCCRFAVFTVVVVDMVVTTYGSLLSVAVADIVVDSSLLTQQRPHYPSFHQV